MEHPYSFSRKAVRGLLAAKHRNRISWQQRPLPVLSEPPLAPRAWTDYYSLALGMDGRISAFGLTYFGEGNVPEGLSGVVAIAAGPGVCMALKDHGTIAVWGEAAGVSNIPAGLEGASAISAGGGLGFCLALAAPTGPRITYSSPDKTVGIGAAVSFRVTAEGTYPLIYQWFRGTEPILGATAATLTLTNVQSDQTGVYHVVVTNAYGTAESTPATLNVLPLLDIKMVPAVLVQGAVGKSYRIEYARPFGPLEEWSTLATIVLTNTPQVPSLTWME